MAQIKYIKASNEFVCLLFQGDGRRLAFLEDNSIDCIVTDHPYKLKGQLEGGNRSFADYELFQYTQEDFKEKYRVLKPGCFLVEFIPEESAINYEYLYKLKSMAKDAGFEYYAKVPWVKGGFVANTGRKSKNAEDVLFLTKGLARSLRPDAKKDKADPDTRHFMSGAAGMLPISFSFEPPKKNARIHQAEKPAKLIEAILSYVARPGEIVLDQFAGSGSTGEACRELNLKAMLIEKNPDFVDRIGSRLGMDRVDMDNFHTEEQNK